MLRLFQEELFKGWRYQFATDIDTKISIILDTPTGYTTLQANINSYLN